MTGHNQQCEKQADDGGKNGFHIWNPDFSRKTGNCHPDPTNAPENSSNRAERFLSHVDPPQISPHHARVLDSLRQRLFHPPKFWSINALVWCAFSLLALFIRYIMHQDLPRAIGLTLAAESLGFVLSGLLLRGFYRTLGPERVLQPAFLLQVAGITLLTGVFQAGLVQAFIHMVNWTGLRWTPLERWVLLSASMWFVYLAWTLGYFWVKAELQTQEERQRTAEARMESQKMELQFLRFQLDPHFLFNSLNGIVSEIPPHPGTAMEMLGELSSYLRYSLDHRQELLTRLAVELDATASYLRIQNARFGERLQTGITASSAARETDVPSFLLQPLVENAFKHGFATVPSPWELHISAASRNGHLVIQVRNSGKLSFPGSEGGLGLDTIRRRLDLHYPGRHRFQMENLEGFVVVTIDLEGPPCSA